MIENGSVFGNVPDNIVNVRTGLDMSSRRGGWKYFKSERRMQRYLLKKKFISFPRYIFNVLLRFGGEVLLSNSLRNRAFKVTREKYRPNSEQDINNDLVKQDHPHFSVAMCVYGGDNLEWFDRALNSVLVEQTVKPNELVLVVDGPIPNDIRNIIQQYETIVGQLA